MRKSAVVFVAVTVFGFAFVHSANAIPVPVDTPTAAASPNIFQAFVTELVDGAAAIIASIETTVGSIADSTGSASQSTNYTYTAAVGTVTPPPRLVVSGEGANASDASAPASATTPPAPPSIPTVTQTSPTVPTTPGAASDNIFELQSIVSELTEGVQGLTALLETQTPSSKIESQIAALQSALSSQGSSSQASGQSYNASAYVPLGDGAPNTIAAASNIGNVSGAAITNLAASEIPDLSGSYLSLSGGNLTGALGIGTTTPWGDLSVDTPANSSLPELVVGSSTATSLFVSNAGNVGIGTASPLYNLDVDNTASTSLQNGLIAWWPLNEGSGTTAFDRVNGRNAVFVGSTLPTWINDGGNAIDVNGTASTGLQAQPAYTSDNTFKFAGDFSVSIWAKIASVGAGNFPYLIGNETFGVWQGWALDAESSGQVNFEVDTGSCCQGVAPSTVVVGDGKWHHYVGVRTGNVISLYIDGVLGATSTATGSIGNAALGLAIGHDPNGYYTSNQEIADARVWNRALSSSEVATLYNQERVGQNPVTRKYTLANRQSSDPNTLFGVGNSTGENNLYSPTLYGYRSGATDTPAISLTGLVSPNGDSASDMTAAVQVNGFVTDNPSDPLNGNLTALSNRNIFSVNAITVSTTSAAYGQYGDVGTTPTQLLSVAADGYVGVGTSAPTSNLNVVSTDFATSTVDNMLTLGHSTLDGNAFAPRPNYGTGILFQGATQNGPSIRNMAQVSAIWTTALDTTRTSALTFSTVNNTGALTERMRITGPGNVGIGTTTPYSRLEVVGPDAASSTPAFAIVSSASSSLFTVFDGGNAQLSGTLTQSSDQRLKTNIQSLDGSSSLAEINALNPITFNWIDHNQDGRPQLGFIAQQVQGIFPSLVSTTSPTALTPDGTLGLNYIDLISPIVAAIQELDKEVTSLASTVAGFADSFTTQELSFNRATGQQLCLQESDGATVCVNGDQLAAVLASASQSGSASASPSPSPSDATDTPPVIQINGDNPAIIQVGASYADLGATIAGPQADLNLGIQTYLNGTPESRIALDTSAAATDTIDYVVTDSQGLTSTSTRTVIVEPADASPASPPTPSIDASSSATTTVQ